MRRACVLAAAALLLLLLLACSALLLVRVYYADELLRRLVVHVLQEKVGGGALRGAPVSLGSAASLRRADGWTLELRHLHVGNVPRGSGGDCDGDWSSPYAVHLDGLRLTVAGKSALLSLMQIPLASGLGAPSLPRAFAGGLDLVAGFRVKSIDVLEVVGTTVHLEDATDEAKQPLSPEVILQRGLLRKGRRELDFVLEPSRISWYEPGLLDGQRHRRERETVGGAAPSSSSSSPSPPKLKPRGVLRLFSSSSVEVFEVKVEGEAGGGGDALVLELISDTDCLSLRAASVDERDLWAAALGDAIAELARSASHPPRGGCSRKNAPWLEALAAEGNARKVRWRRREWRRRREWSRRWRSDGEGEDEDEDEDEAAGDLTGGGNADGEDDAGSEKDGEEDGEAGEGANFFAGLRNLHSNLEGRRLSAREQRLEDALEWHIGRLEVRGLALHINGRHLALDDDDGGWALRGFVGSGSELKRRLNFGLVRKVLKDSSGRVLKSGISGYTGKEDYAFGDLTKSTVNKVGAGVAAGVSGFTGKEEYAFGDVTKTTVNKVGAAVAVGVSGFTGKDEYAFGDVTKTTVNKVGAGVAAGVSGFTGKEEYAFGDVTKTTVNKVGAGVAAGVSSFTGKEEYAFGDLTKTTVNKVGAGVAAGVSGFTGKEEYAFGDVTKAVLAKLTPRKATPIKSDNRRVDKCEETSTEPR